LCFTHFGQYVPFLLAPSSPLLVPLSHTFLLVYLRDPPYLYLPPLRPPSICPCTCCIFC
jgi:hypothetical protein